MKKISSRHISEGVLHPLRDPLLHVLQTPKAKKDMRIAFNAGPSKLGLCAVEAARKSR